MYVLRTPHTGVLPHPCSAADVKRLGTCIKWTTDDPAALASLHQAIVGLVEQVGISGLVEIANSVKMTTQVARTFGGNWHDIIKEAARDGVEFPVPDDVLRHIKGFM
jgi:hypothetical protein